MYVFDYLTKKETVKTIAHYLEEYLRDDSDFEDGHVYANEYQIDLENKITVYISASCVAKLITEEDTNSSWVELWESGIDVSEIYVELDGDDFELTEYETKILTKLIEKALWKQN